MSEKNLPSAAHKSETQPRRAMDAVNSEVDRRGFLKTVASVAAVATGVAVFGRARLVVAQDLPALAESDPIATTLGYYKDATKVDLAKWTKKAGPDGAKQLCSNCMFYQGDIKKIDNADYGKCTIFQAGLVASAGWCNSWTAKPA